MTTVVGGDAFANRLKCAFEGDDDDAEEDQDWFVNDDKRAASPVEVEGHGVSDDEGEGEQANGDASHSHSKSLASASSTAQSAFTDKAVIPPPAAPSVISATPSQSSSRFAFKLSAFGKSSPTSGSPTVEDSESDLNDGDALACPTAFLHYLPPPETSNILVMELCRASGNGISTLVLGDEAAAAGPATAQRRYAAKCFKIYLPQVHDEQTEFCLFARKRIGKPKYRFSLEEQAMTKWTGNRFYDGKMELTTTAKNGGIPSSKKFRLATPKNAARVQFDVDQEARKLELVVRLNAQAPTKGLSLLRSKFASSAAQSSQTDGPMEYRSLLQKFINPLADVRCPHTGNTVFKIEKEGDVGSEKYVISYSRPFSLFVSCCIAVGLESQQLE